MPAHPRPLRTKAAPAQWWPSLACSMSMASPPGSFFLLPQSIRASEPYPWLRRPSLGFRVSAENHLLPCFPCCFGRLCRSSFLCRFLAGERPCPSTLPRAVWVRAPLARHLKHTFRNPQSNMMLHVDGSNECLSDTRTLKQVSPGSNCFVPPPGFEWASDSSQDFQVVCSGGQAGDTATEGDMAV